MIIRPQVEEMHALIRSMRDKGQMTQGQYLKCVLSLAYEYALAGEMADATHLVKECDESYLSSILPEQMRADPVFHEVAFKVAMVFAQEGTQKADEPIVMTSKEVGRA